MFKLVFSDIYKNQKLFIGTIISVTVTVGIILACMNLIFGVLANNDYGHRFDNAEMVIQNTNQIQETYLDGDDEEVEDEDIDGIIYFTQTQINDLDSRYDITLDNTFYLELVDYKTNKLSGHNVSSMDLSGFELIEGTLPSSNEVLLDETLKTRHNLSLGDTITVRTRNGNNTFTISGLVDSDIEDIYVLQNYVFLNDDEATLHSLGISSVAINVDNINQVKDTLKDEGYVVYTGTDVNRAEMDSIVKNNMSLFIIFITMGAICLGVSLFVISGTIQFSIKNREKHFALLRIIGFTKGQVNKVISIQNIVVSFAGSVFGILLSKPLADLILDLYFDLGIVGPDLVGVSNTLVTLIVCGSITLLVFVVSLLTSRRTLSVSAMSAFKQEGSKQSEYRAGSIIFGFFLLAGSISIVIFTPFYGGIGVGMGFCAVMVAIMGLMFVSPLLMRFVNFILSIFTKTMHENLGQVANANVLYKASKFSVAAISIAIIISINGVMILNNYTYIDVTANRQYEEASNYDYISFNMREDEIDIDDYYGVVNSSIVLENNQKINELSVLGVNKVNTNITIVEGRTLENDNEIIISERQKRLSIGDTYRVWTENGEEFELTVVGVYEEEIDQESYKGIMYDDKLLADSYKNQYNTVYSNEVLPGSVTHNVEFYENNPAYDIQVAATLLMTLISFCLSLVALFNTFFVIMSVREAEFNGLKVIGATRKQIINMTIIETIVVVITGIIMGLLILGITVGRYSYVNTLEYTVIVDSQIFWGLVLSSGILGFIAGYIPSVYTINRLKQSLRVE